MNKQKTKLYVKKKIKDKTLNFLVKKKSEESKVKETNRINFKFNIF